MTQLLRIKPAMQIVTNKLSSESQANRPSD